VRVSGGDLHEVEAPTEAAAETHTDVCQEIFDNMTDEDVVQMGGRRFLEVP